MSKQVPFLWSAKVKRFWRPWEAWIENEHGGVIRSTFDLGWTEKSARRKALKRWARFNRDIDVPGTKKGTPAP